MTPTLALSVTSTQALGPLCALLSSAVWAAASMSYTKSAQAVGAATTNLLRILIAVPVYWLLAVLFVPSELLWTTAPASLGWLAVSTGCSFVIGDVTFYMAAMRLGAPMALAVAAIYPAWATLAGVVTLGEHLTPLRGLGVLACLLGVVWLVLTNRSGKEQTPTRTSRAGLLLALLTSVLWAGNSYAIRRAGSGTPFLVANGFRFSLAVLPLGLLFLWQGKRSLRVCLAQAGTLRMILVSMGEAVIGSSLFVYALSHSELSIGAPLSSLAPLFAVPLGIVLQGERPSLQRLLATCLTVLGVLLLVA